MAHATPYKCVACGGSFIHAKQGKPKYCEACRPARLVRQLETQTRARTPRPEWSPAVRVREYAPLVAACHLSAAGGDWGVALSLGGLDPSGYDLAEIEAEARSRYPEAVAGRPVEGLTELALAAVRALFAELLVRAPDVAPGQLASSMKSVGDALERVQSLFGAASNEVTVVPVVRGTKPKRTNLS